ALAQVVESRQDDRLLLRGELEALRGAASAFDVHRRRPPQPPVPRAELRDIGDVDARVVVREFVPVEKIEDVSLVLLVDSEDLQLREQEIAERNRLPGGREPLADRPCVAHLEATDEDVDTPFVRGVVEEQPTVAVEAVELVVALVAERLEQLHGPRPLAAGRDEVDVVVGSRQERRAAKRNLDRKTAEQAEVDLRRRVEDALRLEDDVVLRCDDAHRTSAGTLLASTATAAPIPRSAGTVGSSCSI